MGQMLAVVSGRGQAPVPRLVPGREGGGLGGQRKHQSGTMSRFRTRAFYLELPVDFSGFFSIPQNKINLMLIKAENPH